MNKIIAYLVGLVIVVFATIPAINFQIPLASDWWPWMVLVAGCLGFYTLFLNVNAVIKILAVGGFINCCLSFSPFLSFVSYFSLLAGCYFYILCSQVRSWKVIFQVVQTVLFLNVFMLVMQAVGHDPINNFGLSHPTYVGIIGQSMQTASMIVVLSGFLISFSRLNIFIPMVASFICASAWTFFCGAAGLLVIAFKTSVKEATILCTALLLIFVIFCLCTKKFDHNFNKLGRAGVWVESVRLAEQRPWTGWGIGSYKFMFPIKSRLMRTQPWMTAHNSFVQLYFEGGRLALLLAVGAVIFIWWRLYSLKLIGCLAGLTMILADAQVHFPERMIQAVPVLIAYFAFLEFKIKERICQRTS